MSDQHIMLKEGTAYLTDHPHLKAHLVAQMHIKGEVAIDAVAEHYSISLSDVYATIAYYYDNQETIETRREAKIKRAKRLGGDNFREVKSE